jgi:hypothetical protein
MFLSTLVWCLLITCPNHSNHLILIYANRWRTSNNFLGSCLVLLFLKSLGILLRATCIRQPVSDYGCKYAELTWPCDKNIHFIESFALKYLILTEVCGTHALNKERIQNYHGKIQIKTPRYISGKIILKLTLEKYSTKIWIKFSRFR